MLENKLTIGLQCRSITQKLEAMKNGFDFIGIHVLNKTLQQDGLEKYTGLLDKDVNVQMEDVSNVFALSWVELDSIDEQIVNKSIQILYDEVQYVSYIGISNFVLPPLIRRMSIPQYARIINHLFSLSAYINFYVFFSMEDDSTESSVLWDIWNTIRICCGYNNRLFLAIDIQRKLPESTFIERWFAEPIGLLIISPDIFVLDSDGCPILPKTHQAFYTKFAKLKPHVLLRTSDDTSITNDSLEYLQHLKYLEQNMDPPTSIEKFADGYQDYLQTPLQPLADNLESLTYGIFEKDHVKYNQYEYAICRALMDRPKSNEPIYISIVGAGRGPLISRSLKAAERADRKIVIYAIDKNPNVFVTLQHRNRHEWNNSVHLVNVDMRSWKPPVLIDIIISELLGSLGDNELSPECLDGAQNFLNPSGGIFIPSSYTAYITPLMAPKLYGNLLRMKEHAVFESFYVTWLHSMDYLVQDNENRFQVLWKFSHPNSDYCGREGNSNFHNTRQCKKTFNVSSKGMLHGFAGYFEAVLYDDIELSTRPDTIDAKSKDMISWFPVFFPLKVPLYVPSNSQIDLYFWRQTDAKKVWYEWLTEVYMVSSNVQNYKDIHDSDRIKIGMSDIHNYKASFSHIGMF